MARKFERLLSQDLNLGVGTATKTSPGGGVLTGTQIGIHTFAIDGAKVQAAWDPTIVAAGGAVSTTVSCPGASLGDFVMVSFSFSIGDLDLTANVDSAGVVKVKLRNGTVSPVDLPSGTLSVLVFKSR